MKALHTDGMGSIAVRDVPEPVVGWGKIGIDSVCSLISAGTELHYIRRQSPGDPPLPLGYCAAGIVRELGEGCADLQIGDRVIAMGWGYALHAQRITVPQRLCVKLDKSRTAMEHAVIANLAATALHSIHRAGPLTADSRILVVGAGLVGQLVARIARLVTPYVAITDRVSGRLEVAKAAGLEAFLADDRLAGRIWRQTIEQGVDVILLCGGGDGFPRKLCSEVLKRSRDGSQRGVIVCVGRFNLSLEASADLGNVDIRISARCGTGYRDDDYVHGAASYAAPQGEGTVDANLRRCLSLIEEGELAVADLVTHRVPFARARDAYQLLNDPQHTLGVILIHEGFGRGS